MTKAIAKGDQIIIDHLRSGQEHRRELAFRLLYRQLYNKAVGWVINQRASEEQARTAFNIALLRLEQKVADEAFVLSSSLSSFLMGILRLVWLEERRKVQSYADLDDYINKEDLIEETEDKDSIQQSMLRCVQQLSKDCQRLLFYKYWLNLNMKQIAQLLGLKGENAAYSAANKKNRCMKKLINECDQGQFLDQ
ncbi:MAG: hypothetical protein AAF242_17085 [Bacteroidota bacterium]